MKCILCLVSLIMIGMFAILCAGCKLTDRQSEYPFFCVAFSLDSRQLAAGRGNYINPTGGKGSGDVVVWSTSTWSEPRVYNNDLTSNVMGVVFADDDHTIIAASDAYLRNVRGSANPWNGKRLYSWAVESGQANDTLLLKDNPTDKYMQTAGFVRQITHCPKLGLIGLTLLGDQPVVIDLKTRKPKYVPEGHQGRDSTCLAFSPNGKTLASCYKLFDNDKLPRHSVILFDADTGRRIADSAAGGVESYCLAFSPNSERLAIGCKTGEVVVLTANLGKTIGTIRVASDQIRAIAYSPKNDCLAVVADSIGSTTSSSVYLINPQEMKVTRILGEKMVWIHALTFSPDGKLLAAAYGTREGSHMDGPRGGVIVWGTATWKLLKDLK